MADHRLVEVAQRLKRHLRVAKRTNHVEHGLMIAVRHGAQSLLHPHPSAKAEAAVVGGAVLRAGFGDAPMGADGDGVVMPSLLLTVAVAMSHVFGEWYGEWSKFWTKILQNHQLDDEKSMVGEENQYHVE